MIRINLLPVKRKKKAQPVPPVFIQSALILIVTILAVVFFSFQLYGKVSDLKAEKASKEQRLVKLKEQLKEVENFERDNEIYKQKSQIIVRLKKQQKAPLRLLDEVSARLSEGVWLSSLDDARGTVTIKGYAFSNSELVSYVQRLKGSEFLTEVALLESKQGRVAEVTVYIFQISFKVKV